MPAPEDIADTVTFAQSPHWLRLIARPVDTASVRARDGFQYVSTSRIDPNLMQRLSQGKEVARSTSENRNHDRTDMQLRRPFNIRADTSWRKIGGRGKETTFSEISAPTSSDHQRMNEEQRKQNRGDTSNMPPQVVVEKSDFNKSPAREKSDVPHRHHSAGFHSFHHIAEHLSSAVGHNAYDLVRGRSEKETRPVSSKTSVKRSPYLRPLTKPKPVTRIDSFHWTQDTVPPGHPGHSGGEMQRPPLTEAATKASKHQLNENVDKETVHKAMNSTLEGTITPFKPKETLSDLNLSRRNAQPRTLRLVSTPPWLKNPTKEAADATAPLHHVDVKSHEADWNDHAYAPGTAVDDWSGHLAVRSINSIRKADTPEERRLPPIRTHNSPSMEATVPEPSHMTPKIHIDRTPSEYKRQYTPISVSKRRKIFESVQDHADTASSVKKASHKHAQLHQEATNRSFASTSHQSDQEPESKRFAEQSSELEIAKPMPIAPPNHECNWKERYVALTAEIRQLKAEMSARASLMSSDILTPRNEQQRDNLDLLAVTVILHSRDRDDIVINTDVARDVGSSNV
ncbi:hypothetical protein FHL15_007252 [Xylaria flabelliformis]|uniref:Uncharacterized protein n=1 Tax=Xylaria flabelliformis TaxID=2512241 RepID=A0A553HVG9_9PEZI|nr:hypothetical protein FHL15_007252 [Xylaria flabelliformis]